MKMEYYGKVNGIVEKIQLGINVKLKDNPMVFRVCSENSIRVGKEYLFDVTFSSDGNWITKVVECFSMPKEKYVKRVTLEEVMGELQDIKRKITWK